MVFISCLKRIPFIVQGPRDVVLLCAKGFLFGCARSSCCGLQASPARMWGFRVCRLSSLRPPTRIEPTSLHWKVNFNHWLPGKPQCPKFYVLPMILIHSVNLGLFWFSIVGKQFIPNFSGWKQPFYLAHDFCVKNLERAQLVVCLIQARH